MRRDRQRNSRGTLKAFGLKVGAVDVADFGATVIELLGDRPRLLAMVQPMLQAREALRQQSAALTKMVIEAVRASLVCRRLLSDQPNRHVDLCDRRQSAAKYFPSLSTPGDLPIRSSYD